MDDFIRKVYERGKITIPKELRDLYDVRDGDLVKLRLIKVVQATERARRGIPESIDIEFRVSDEPAEVEE